MNQNWSTSCSSNCTGQQKKFTAPKQQLTHTSYKLHTLNNNYRGKRYFEGASGCGQTTVLPVVLPPKGECKAGLVEQ